MTHHTDSTILVPCLTTENDGNIVIAKATSLKRVREDTEDYNETESITTGLPKTIVHPQMDVSTIQIMNNLNNEGANWIPMTTTGSSWIIYVPNYLTPQPSQFEEEWNLHPNHTRPLGTIYGRQRHENRYSTFYVLPHDGPKYYRYSRNNNPAVEIHPGRFLHQFLHTCNTLVDNLFPPHNSCLQNWYTPDHTISLHSDNEKQMHSRAPIFSLSWGGTRRFLLRPISNTKIIQNEFWLRDGDLLIMGGTLQKTHKHEVLKYRKTMDLPTSNRINYTIRCFV